jgi:hypothetical protein
MVGLLNTSFSSMKFELFWLLSAFFNIQPDLLQGLLEFIMIQINQYFSSIFKTTFWFEWQNIQRSLASVICQSTKKPSNNGKNRTWSIFLNRMFNKISSGVDFKRWWVLKSKISGQESTYSKQIFSKISVDELQFIKKCQNCIFKVNFWCQKSTEFFQKNLGLGQIFCPKD